MRKGRIRVASAVVIQSLFVAAMVGCDASQSPSPATPGPGPTAAASAAPSATGPEATPTAAIPLPPGAQYEGAPVAIPGEAEPVLAQFLTRAYFFAQRDGHPEALYREAAPWLGAVIDDGAGYRPPAGSSLDAPFRVVAAAAGDKAMVVLGSSTTTDRDRPAGLERLPESVIWVTRDGKTFERIDPRGVVADAAGLRLTDVVRTDDGFVVVGNALPKGFDGPGDIVVLRSGDGVAWTAAARLEGQGTLHARRLLADADRLVIDAAEQWCDGRGITFPHGLRTGITAAWGSSDGGDSWTSVDLSAADPVLSQPDALVEGCPASAKLDELVAISQDLDTDGAIVGLAGGVLVARSRDGTTLGVSRDLATWTQVVLPEAVPLANEDRRPYAQSIVLDVSGAIRMPGKLALLALEDRPDLEGRPRSGGCQVRWWRTEDGGGTWSTGPWGRPFATCAGATWTFAQLLDGSVVLFANEIMANQNRGEASFRTASPGVLIPWETCAPGPKVDCSFATIAHPVGGGADWSEINLSGATVTTAAAQGLRMSKANAYAALLSGRFRSADLSEALLGYAILEGDFSRVDLHDAFLFHAIIRADLTLSMFGGAELSGATVGEGTVCPDGEAPTSGVADLQVACRF